jgi:aminopeptidase N
MAVLIFILFQLLHGADTDPYPRNPSIDILHYKYHIELYDSTNVIRGHAQVTVRYKQSSPSFDLNLANKNAEGRGMEVFEITLSGKPVQFVHRGDRISISNPATVGDTVLFEIFYGGQPIDGLVIDKNKFGDRTFFGDNWPDRGRHWLPSIDHPHDKAKVDFVVTAPDHYNVVATGQLVSEKNLSGKRKEHHWHEKADVAIKVVTVGVARFSVQKSGVVDGVPITTWVFPQNEKAGFADFAVAPEVFRFMQDYIGPYPYEKLAHVQSTTRFGGLENVSNIFYFENSVNGLRQRESLIAHETAHQWFGNSVTEHDWHHVWLSEGFATYLAALYKDSVYRHEVFASEMQEQRQQVRDHAARSKSIIIDTTITDINDVLNTSVYQKASWVLHMLRAKVGAGNFKTGLRAYYARFRDSNASTSDFIETMEAATDQRLREFMTAWLFQQGIPHLSGTWWYDAKSGTVSMAIKSQGFALPERSTIAVSIRGRGSSVTIDYPLPAAGNSTQPRVIKVPLKGRPHQVVLDPRTEFLFEGEMVEKR